MPNIEFKTFIPAYTEGVVSLIVNIQQLEYNIPIDEKAQPDIRNIATFYQVKKGNFWVALDGEIVVGTIGLLDIGDDLAALRKMFVAKEYRGSSYGVAGILLGTLLRWAESHRVERVFLGTTEKFMAAHRFYEKNGFIEIQGSELPNSFPKMAVDTRFYSYAVERA